MGCSHLNVCVMAAELVSLRQFPGGDRGQVSQWEVHCGTICPDGPIPPQWTGWCRAHSLCRPACVVKAADNHRTAEMCAHLFNFLKKGLSPVQTAETGLLRISEKMMWGPVFSNNLHDPQPWQRPGGSQAPTHGNGVLWVPEFENHKSVLFDQGHLTFRLCNTHTPVRPTAPECSPSLKMWPPTTKSRNPLAPHVSRHLWNQNASCN